jgi:hypothetical protein
MWLPPYDVVVYVYIIDTSFVGWKIRLLPAVALATTTTNRSFRNWVAAAAAAHCCFYGDNSSLLFPLTPSKLFRQQSTTSQLYIQYCCCCCSIEGWVGVSLCRMLFRFNGAVRHWLRVMKMEPVSSRRSCHAIIISKGDCNIPPPTTTDG